MKKITIYFVAAAPWLPAQAPFVMTGTDAEATAISIELAGNPAIGSVSVEDAD